MKIDVLDNYVRAHMARGKFTHVVWDGQVMDADTFIEEARGVIYCETPNNITDCLNDVIEQVQFITEDKVLKIQFGELENVTDLMEFKAQIALERVVSDLGTPEEYGCNSYYEVYIGLISGFKNSKGGHIEPYWPTNMEAYAELDDQEFCERFYALEQEYEEMSFVLDRLKNRPEAMSWLVNGKGLNDE